MTDPVLTSGQDQGIHISAPGSLMLMGEHAVLRGYLALVGATDRRIHVHLYPRSDRQVRITSALGDAIFNLAALPTEGPLRFVTASVGAFAGRLKQGLSLTIESEISSTVGLGSSAAVTVATMAALHDLLGDDAGPDVLQQEATRVIQRVQGLGSGADVAASVLGGVVAYRMTPRMMQPIATDLPMALLYSGSKMPTPEVVRRVNAFCEREPTRSHAVFESMHALAGAACEALRQSDLPEFGALMTRAQQHMRELDVSNPELEAIVTELQATPGIVGAKISGSGLGDCVIGVGETERNAWSWEQIDVTIGASGVRREEPDA